MNIATILVSLVMKAGRLRFTLALRWLRLCGTSVRLALALLARKDIASVDSERGKALAAAFAVDDKNAVAAPGWFLDCLKLKRSLAVGRNRWAPLGLDG
ncbi:hypothetical protein P3T18_000736 [Paraburkholderia sp. GAS199]|uniref:hypothetical protein n=1 Tax=Paraburkholderia sp. GAS199 TaxID=3035126 RepID=UPI003D1B90AF